MSKALLVGPGTAWPAKIASEATALLGTRGAGKSNLARVMVEECHRAKIPCVVFDPIGNWYGIRAGKTGRAEGGLPFVIFGGPHGDVPLEPTKGAELADTIIDMKLNSVLDLSHPDLSANEQRRFLTSFGDRLFRRKQPETGWMLLVLEEADDYAPQSPRGPQAETLSIFQKLIKRGRYKGLGALMITQRSASINKDLLNMIGTLVTFRTTAPLDQKAIEGWIKYHSLSTDVLESLSGLEDGEAWVWSPEFLKELRRVRFRRMSTYDTGATPKHATDATGQPPATLADVDIPALRKRFAAVIERAKAEDPRALRAEITRLKTELTKKPGPAITGTAPKTIEKPILKDAQIKRLESAIDRLLSEMTRTADVLAQRQQVVVGEAGLLRSDLQLATRRLAGQHQAEKIAQHMKAYAPAERLVARASRPTSDGLTPGHVSILAALAQHGPLSRSALGVLAVTPPGSLATWIPQLKQAGLLDTDGSLVQLTDAGRLPDLLHRQPDVIRSLWREKLHTPGVQRIFDTMVELYPAALTRRELAEKAGVPPGSFATWFPKISSQHLVEREGAGYRLRSILFE